MAKAIALGSSGGVVKGAGGRVWGYVIGSATSCTVKIWDNATTGAGRVILDTTTAVSAPFNGTWGAPVDCVNGIYLTIGGTGTVTVLFD